MSTPVSSDLKGYYCTITKDVSGGITDITNETAMDSSSGFKFPKDPNKVENFNAVIIENSSPVDVNSISLDFSSSIYSFNMCHYDHCNCNVDPYGGCEYNAVFTTQQLSWPTLKLDIFSVDTKLKVKNLIASIDPIVQLSSGKPLLLTFKPPLKPNESMLLDFSQANVNIANTESAFTVDISNCYDKDPVNQCTPQPMDINKVSEPFNTATIFTIQSTDPSTYGGDTPSGGGGGGDTPSGGDVPKASIDINLKNVLIFLGMLLGSLFILFVIKLLWNHFASPKALASSFKKMS